MPLEFTDDPAAFLAAADEHLAADPVLTTVIATVTRRMAARPAVRGAGDADPCWWVIARDLAGEVAGVAMRTAPFEPYPAYVLPMPDDLAVELARTLHARGERLAAVNGALPAARVVAEETARLAGGAVSVHEELRLFELGDLVLPPAPPGELRLATRDDAALCLDWFHAFGGAAAEQAGRSDPHGSGTETFTLEELHGRIDEQTVWLWEDGRGHPVHLTAANPPAHGVVRIGPVYTPREHRGRGYAGRAVAEVSRRYVEQGVRSCLFADRANPVSTSVYEAIGYRGVVDLVNLLVG